MVVSKRIVGWLDVECGNRRDYRNAHCCRNCESAYIPGNRLEYSYASFKDGRSYTDYRAGAGNYNHLTAKRAGGGGLQLDACGNRRHTSLHLVVSKREPGWLDVECGDRCDYRNPHCRCDGESAYLSGDGFDCADAGFKDREFDADDRAGTGDYHSIAAERASGRGLQCNACSYWRNDSLCLVGGDWLARWTVTGPGKRSNYRNAHCGCYEFDDHVQGDRLHCSHAGFKDRHA